VLNCYYQVASETDPETHMRIRMHLGDGIHGTTIEGYLLWCCEIFDVFPPT
jgi:hypothetical protein